MTTTTWSSGNIHDSDANFRIWGSEFSAKLALCGLIQTADTGQINWATVLRPAAGAVAGYEIWRFNDAMQASAPIFLRFNFGTSSAATGPSIRVELGTGSDGAGVITGIGSGVAMAMNHGDTVSGSATPTPSYFCHTEGSFGWIWKWGQSAQGCGVIARTVDATGTPTALGVMMWGYGGTSATNNSYNNLRMIRFASTATVVYSATGSTGAQYVTYVPGWLASSLLQNGDKQIYLAWGAFPEVQPVNAFGIYRATEFAQGSTFSVALVGSTPHTYIASGHQADGIAAGSVSHLMCFLWE